MYGRCKAVQQTQHSSTCHTWLNNSTAQKASKTACYMAAHGSPVSGNVYCTAWHCSLSQHPACCLGGVDDTTQPPNATVNHRITASTLLHELSRWFIICCLLLQPTMAAEMGYCCTPGFPPLQPLFIGFLSGQYTRVSAARQQ